MARPRLVWSEDMIELACRLRGEEGASVEEVARAIFARFGQSMSINTVRNKLNDLGVTTPDHVDARTFDHRRNCLWPIGNPMKRGFHFCGAAIKDPNQPYCDQHTDEARKRGQVFEGYARGCETAAAE